MSEEVKNPEAVLAELRRAQADLIALREELTKANTAKETAEAALESATSGEAEAEWKKRAINSEARLGLHAQGIKDADRFLKFIDTDKLDFDSEGKLTGLDENLAQLKKDLPEVFDAKRRAGGTGDLFANSEVEDKPSPLRAAVNAALSTR